MKRVVEIQKSKTNLYLTLSWWRSISYRNQSIDLKSKSMDWFLYDIGLLHEMIKFIHNKECLGLCETWWVRNPKKKRKTFRQQHVIGFVQRRLDYFLVSNNLKESINKMDILTTLSTNHSPIFFSLPKNIDISRSEGLWKFNNTLCQHFDSIL